MIDFLQYPQAFFSSYFIKNKILKDVLDVKYIWIKGGEYQEGKVNIFAIDNQFVLSNENKKKIEDSITSILPANLNKNNIIIQSPTIENIDLELVDLYPDIEDLKKRTSKNLTIFIQNKLNFMGLEFEIDEDELKVVIFNSSYLNLKVQKFKFKNWTDKIKKQNTIYKFNEIKINNEIY